jgi:hypothetical protein
MKFDFFARRAHYLDHLAPIWNALSPARRGTFYVIRELEPYARQELEDGRIEIYEGGIPAGDDPILTAAYGDLNKVLRNPNRRIITVEHGVTQGFEGAAYPNAKIGNRARVDLALLPNEYVASRFRAVRSTPCDVIGTPKLDPFAEYRKRNQANQPVIAIAFHWGNPDTRPPESGSAWRHYKEILPQLREAYTVIGHGHPLAAEIYKTEFEKIGIEWVSDFRDVMRRASIYINDLSSTMYEFLVTGKPVIVLNAPWFRRSVHWGIRFWDHSDVGINVEDPRELFDAIERTLAEYSTICLFERARAIHDLYPYLGTSAVRAVEVLEGFLHEQS